MSIKNLVPMFVFVGGTAAAAETQISDSVAKFLQTGRAVIAQIGADVPNAAIAITAINGMLNEAKPIITAWGQKHSQCVSQIAKVIELYPQIEAWTAQEIRLNIERGTALPNAAGCYAARDVVAHPAITRALIHSGIQPDQKTRLVHEMNEAIEHMEEIAKDLE